MKTAHQPVLNPDSANLDLLRALAVSLVVGHHVAQTMGWHQFGAVPGWQVGRAGVLLFFVHTSLVLLASLARLDARGESLFAGFYVRRAFRIYPLAIVAVILALALSLPPDAWNGPHARPWTSREILSNLTLTMNLTYSASMLSPLWTLPYEVQMYGLLPVVYLLVRRWGFRAAMALFGAACVVGETQRVLPLVGRLDVMQFAPCFVAGAVAYSLSGRVRRVLPGWSWPVVLGALLPVYALTALPKFWRLDQGWVFCFLVGLAVPFAQEMGLPLLRRLAQQVARYSYGVYLSHGTALWVGAVVLAGQPMAVRVLVTLALGFGVPVLAYHAIEAPMVRLGARLATAFRATPPVPVEVPVPALAEVPVPPRVMRHAAGM